MKPSSVTLRVENFRAIGKAEIKLDGITVVAGMNGCGKSTLSKLLYTAFRLSTDFGEIFITEQFEEFINKYLDIRRYLFQSLDFKIKTRGEELYYRFRMEFLELKHSDYLEKINSIKKQLNILKMRIEKQEIQSDINKIERFWKICFENLAGSDTEIKKYLGQIKGTNSWSVMIDFLIFYVQFEQRKITTNLLIQPVDYFNQEVKNIFHINYLPKKLEILEKEVSIVSSENENMMTPFEIDNVIYIDTPMSFNHYEEIHWQDLNEKLKKRPKFNQSAPKTTEIDDLMKREILTGQAEIKFDELSESFTFRTPSGAEIDLSDSATGIKAFAVLNLLLKNGSINSKTLLILDEPEAHLHPQWVVEFGRLLTLINKHIGAKIFVATHSPDMVQALRYIPNKEGIGERVNFYLAEYNSETHLFDYQDLEGKVGKIFTSFNKSLDKLEQYGEE